jgi:hypothetical protein
MIGDGVCNEECNVTNCSFDLADCCPCSDDELGNCEVECLTADCGYDEDCEDTFLKDSARYFQLIKHDLQAELDFDDCYEADPNCSLDDLKAFHAGTGEDLSKCKSEECFAQYGQTECCPASMNCKKCAGGHCLECHDDYYNYYTTCLSACPPGFTVQSKTGRICYRKPYSAYTDSSSASFYTNILVGTADIYENYKKYSLIDALASAWNAYSSILIIDPVVDLSPMTEAMRKETSSASIYSPLEKSIQLGLKVVLIDSNNCLESNEPACLEDYPEIRVTHRLMTLVVKGFRLEIRHVKITGYYALNKDCRSANCSYCPYLISYRDAYFDDRHNKYSDKPDWEQCSDVSTSFIETDCQASLLIDIVQLTDFRLQQFAFVKAAGSVKITKLDMRNVSSSGSLGGAFIVQDCSQCSACTFELSLSTLKHFNNGYELRSDLSQSGFLLLTSSAAVILDTVTISSSMLSSTNKQPFLKLIDIGKLTLQQLAFNNVAVSDTLVYLCYSYIVNPPVTIKDGFSADSLEAHITIYQFEVRNVTASDIVYVYISNNLKNIQAYRLTAVDSLAYSSFFTFELAELPTTLNKYGGYATISEGGGKKAYKVLKSNMNYQYFEVSNCYWGKYFMKTNNLVNESVIGFQINNSGQYKGDLTAFTYKPLVEDEAFYLSVLPVLKHSIDCEGTLAYLNTFSLQVKQIELEQVKCAGSPGIETSTSNDVRYTQVSFSEITSVSAYSEGRTVKGSVIDVDGTTAYVRADISEVYVKGLVSLGYGAVVVTQAQVSITNSEFHAISASAFSGVHCSVCMAFSSEALVFDDIYSKSSAGACINLSFSIEYSGGITVKQSSFHKCRVEMNLGAAFYLDNAPNALLLQLADLVFSQGVSRQSGSAIFIGTTAYLTADSSLTNCVFKHNVDEGAALIDINVSSTLTFRSCKFTDNSNKGRIVSIVASLGTYTIHFVDCIFDNNAATTVLSMIGKSQETSLMLTSSSISNSTGYTLEAKYVSFTATNCAFTKGSSPLRIIACAVTLSSAEFSYNTISNGGVVEVYEESILDCEDCVFMNNYGTSGGAFRVDTNSVIKVKNSKFTFNTGDIGSALYFINTDIASLIQDSEIAYNHAEEVGTIYAVMAQVALVRVKLHSNTSANSPSIYAQSSDVSLEDCALYNQTSTFSSFVFASQANFNIKGGSISNSLGDSFMLFSAYVDIEGLTASDITSNFISTQGYCAVTIRRSRFDRLLSRTDGALLYLTDGTVWIEAVQVSHFNTTALYIFSADSVTVQDSTFECKAYSDGTCEYNCVAVINNVRRTQLLNDKFMHNRAVYFSSGMSIGEQANLMVDSEVFINGSLFLNNTAEEAGAMKLSIYSAVVTHTEFTDNTATDGDGGSILAACELQACNYTFSHNNFTRNSASLRGGAIYWTAQPVLEDNAYSLNKAEYGPNVGSFGVSLVLLYDDDADVDGRVLKLTENFPLEAASGQWVPTPIRVGLVDHYGQIVKTDNSSQCDILPTNVTSTAVTGDTRVKAAKGVYVFDDIVISASPMSSEVVKLSSDAIRVEESSGQQLQLPVNVRSCISGEALVGEACTVCQPGFYSLDPSQTCAECPSEAVCYGGSLMVPKAGYWRSSKTSSEFLECPVKAACRGSPHIMPCLTGECSRGYRGNLCQACENEFSRSSPNQCAQCPDKGSNIAKLIGLSLIVCLICAVLVRSSLKTAYEPTAQHSIYLKIFTNYLQLVLIVTQLNLDWPSFVRSYFEKQSTAGSVDQQVFSFDCYLAGDSPKGDTYKQVYFDRLILNAFLPLIISFVATLFWLCVYYHTRKRSILRKELIATLVILFFLVHPNLVKEYFVAFNCRRLDDTTLWLNYNLDIECYDTTHSFFAYSVALPAILTWGIGVPTLILGVIVKKRKQLDQLLMKCRFGFFYNGFKKSHFYWEFLILYRKILIISLSVFLGNVSIPVQALTIMIILLVFLYLQYNALPYASEALNAMETKAILVSSVTIYCGLYYLTKDLSVWMKVGLFTVMVIVNALFFYWFAKEFLKTILQMLGAEIKLFKRFAVKEDAFPTADVTSKHFTLNKSYVTSDRTLRATLSASKEPLFDQPYDEATSSLFGTYFEAHPVNHYATSPSAKPPAKNQSSRTQVSFETA